MKVVLFICLQLLIILAGSERSRISIVNFGCNHDEKLITGFVCRYKPARGKLGIFSFGGNPVKPWTTLWVKFDIFKKNSANTWQLGKVHLIQDICAFYREKNNLFLLFFSQFKESVFDKIIKECPYTERVELNNFTLERKDADAVLKIFPVIATGDFMVNLTMSMDRNGNRFISHLYSVLYVKGIAMRTNW